MPSTPDVTINFKGNTSNIDQATAKVEADLRGVSQEASRVGNTFRDTGEGMQNVQDAAGGLVDIGEGLGRITLGITQGDMLEVATGIEAVTRGLRDYREISKSLGGVSGAAGGIGAIGPAATGAAGGLATLGSAIAAIAPPLILIAGAAAAAYLVFKNWDKIGPWLRSAGETVSEFGRSMMASLNRLGGQIGTFFKGLPGELKSTAKDWARMGADLVRGVYQGMRDAWDWLSKMAKSLFGGLVQDIKKLLKIGSPSKLFEDEIGKPIGQAIGTGATQAIPSATAQIGRAVEQMPSAITPQIAIAAPDMQIGRETPGGGGGIMFIVNYQPQMSFATEREFERNLLPILRKMQATG